MTLYFLMNINDLAAIAMSSQVNISDLKWMYQGRVSSSRLPVYKTLLENPKGKPHVLMNINELSPMAMLRIN